MDVLGEVVGLDTLPSPDRNGCFCSSSWLMFVHRRTRLDVMWHQFGFWPFGHLISCSLFRICACQIFESKSILLLPFTHPNEWQKIEATPLYSTGSRHILSLHYSSIFVYLHWTCSNDWSCISTIWNNFQMAVWRRRWRCDWVFFFVPLGALTDSLKRDRHSLYQNLHPSCLLS